MINSASGESLIKLNKRSYFESIDLHNTGPWKRRGERKNGGIFY